MSDARRYVDIGPFDCEAGGHLPNVTLAYEEWGPHDAETILICHALSGDSHATGWWDRMVGPGRPIDTDRFRVVCTNALGGCQGSTGPSSPHPDGGPYGSRFPILTMADIVRAQRALLDRLGIAELLMVAGGSMGGMQALEWTLRFPGFCRKAFIAASCAAHTAMQIGFNEVARQAVMRDPAWLGGNYQPGNGPNNGLAVARMLGHLTYLSEASFTRKFARRYQGKDAPAYHLGVEFEVESYLKHQGEKFTVRFDANSLLVLTRAIDYFERTSFAGSSTDYLFTSFTSDWIYPSWQSHAMAAMAADAGCPARHEVIDLPFGHDAFLLDGDLQGDVVRAFLTA